MSDHHPTHRRRLLALGSAVLLTLAVVTPALAWQAEGEYKNCVDRIAYVHARYNDLAWLIGPGGTGHDYGLNNGTWQVSERNGTYGGNWLAQGFDLLDFPNTWAGCRNYG